MFPEHEIFHKCVCGRGFVPDPAIGAYSTPPDSLDGFKLALFYTGGQG